MKIIEDFKYKLPSLSAALGFFDGVHIGHQRIITEAVSYAKAKGLSSAVVTLSGHPANILSGHPVVPILTDNTEKARIIESLGVDYFIIMPFDKDFSSISPATFVKEILKDKLNVAREFCGSNYSFGAEGIGHADDLLRLGKKFGIETEIISPIKKSGFVISSSYIRSYISAGKIRTANELLGRPYCITAPVIHGKRLGTTLLFPTINQCLPENLAVLKYGVYATSTVIDGTVYKSVTNVGVRPTVDSESSENAETYILDFEGELYGKNIRVEYMERLRDEVRFFNIEVLKKQIASDIETRKNLPLQFSV